MVKILHGNFPPQDDPPQNLSRLRNGRPKVMDTIAKLPIHLPAVIDPTFDALRPLLAANDQAIKAGLKTRETHQFGSTAADSLDVYYPPGIKKGSPQKVLVYLFGGGFFAGNKNHPKNPEYVFANLGTWFASKGITTVIGNYRLSKGPGNPNGPAKYPSGAEDLQDMLKWVEKNIPGSEYYVMGNSAGGVHVATFLYDPQFRDYAAKTVKRAVLVGMPGHQCISDGSPIMSAVNAAYYGDADGVLQKSPIALVKNHGIAKSTPPVLGLTSELDPPEILSSFKHFADVFTGAGGQIKTGTLAGHNHISPVIGLNCSDPAFSAWANQVVDWIKQ